MVAVANNISFNLMLALVVVNVVEVFLQILLAHSGAVGISGFELVEKLCVIVGAARRRTFTSRDFARFNKKFNILEPPRPYFPTIS